MAKLLGLLADESQAAAVLEALRAVRFNVDQVRLVGGPDGAAELAARAGPSVPVAGGPAASLLGGLLESQIPAQQLSTIRGRMESGAVLLVAEDLDEGSAGQLTDILRQHHAEHITSGPSA